MASRRMFSIRLISSARFLKMPISSQALYFHLGLNADDDGVVEAYNVLNSLGCSEDDLRVLVAKGFVKVLNEDLVSYIVDWNENNSIRPDRKIDSIYKNLLVEMLPDIELIERRQRADVKPKIIDDLLMDNQWTTIGQPMDGIGKDRLGKGRIEKESIGKDNTPLISPLGGKETLLDMFNRLSEGKQLSEPLKDKLREWMQYKKERKEGYKETGLKSFLTQMEKHEQRYGSSALIDCIDLCMARNYKGIITDLITEKKKPANIDDEWKGIK